MRRTYTARAASTLREAECFLASDFVQHLDRGQSFGGTGYKQSSPSFTAQAIQANMGYCLLPGNPAVSLFRRAVP